MTFASLFKDKNVLFIPIYSARSYETGIYQLQNDGNFARIYSTVKSLPLKSATILIPNNSELHLTDENNIKYIRSKYGKNAMSTRQHLEFIDLPLDIISRIDNNGFDFIVSEPNYLTLMLAKQYQTRTIYWCVASVTSEGTPWFVKDYEEVDKKIASLIPTAVSNRAQQLSLKGKSFVEPSFYNAELFDFKSIYFPFRLTDENYHAKEFISAIEELAKDKTLSKFKVFYPDLNDCNMFADLDKDIFIKVPKNHELYIQLLKSKPIIPYLENADMLEHISIREFLYYDVELIMLKLKHSTINGNITFLNDIDELKSALRKKLL